MPAESGWHGTTQEIGLTVLLSSGGLRVAVIVCGMNNRLLRTAGMGRKYAYRELSL